LVDDEESIRQTLPPIFEEQGFEVRTAASLAEALAEIDASTYDVLQEGDGRRG
jgi:DNA-binding response OmpR family regulator